MLWRTHQLEKVKICRVHERRGVGLLLSAVQSPNLHTGATSFDVVDKDVNSKSQEQRPQILAFPQHQRRCCWMWQGKTLQAVCLRRRTHLNLKRLPSAFVYHSQRLIKDRISGMYTVSIARRSNHRRQDSLVGLSARVQPCDLADTERTNGVEATINVGGVE